MRDRGGAKRPVLPASMRDGADDAVRPDGGAVRGTENGSCGAQAGQSRSGAMAARTELEQARRRRAPDEIRLRG